MADLLYDSTSFEVTAACKDTAEVLVVGPLLSMSCNCGVMRSQAPTVDNIAKVEDVFAIALRRVFTQPRNYTSCGRVNLLHDIDLITTFFRLTLIDTKAVNPKIPASVMITKAAESMAKIARD